MECKNSRYSSKGNYYEMSVLPRSRILHIFDEYDITIYDDTNAKTKIVKTNPNHKWITMFITIWLLNMCKIWNHIQGCHPSNRPVISTQEEIISSRMLKLMGTMEKIFKYNLRIWSSLFITKPKGKDK